MLNWKATRIMLVMMVSLAMLSGCGDAAKDKTSGDKGNKQHEDHKEGTLKDRNKPTGAASGEANGKDDGLAYEQADVDGDGVKEDFLFTGKAGDREFTLHAGKADLKTEGENIDGTCQIVSIAPNRNLIAVPESGPSGDDATNFFAYRADKGDIVFVAKIQGKGDDLSFKGDNTILSHRVRGQILQTWYHIETYKIAGDYTVMVEPQDLYDMNTSVKVLQSISLQKSPDDKSISLKLAKGDEAVIKASDDKKWCLVTKDGKEGWFAVESFSKIQSLNLDAREVFEGLSYAD